MPARALVGELGLSLTEVLIASALLLIVIAGVGVTMSTGRDAAQQTSTVIKLDDDLRRVLRRITEELRSASLTAEDTNGNSALDGGEDTNGNGRLDADWSVTSSSITFNRLLPDGTFSLPQSFTLSGGSLVYEKQTDPLGEKITTPIARSVPTFTVAESNATVSITLALSAQTSDGSPLLRSQSVKVTLRN